MEPMEGIETMEGMEPIKGMCRILRIIRYKIRDNGHK